jgi:hypothetical protein
MIIITYHYLSYLNNYKKILIITFELPNLKIIKLISFPSYRYHALLQ